MSETRRWFRFATEGTAIVASILVAFAIDAWWAGRQVLAEEQELLSGLVEEFEGNASLVDQTLGRSLRARADLQRLLSLSSDELRSPSLSRESDLGDTVFEQLTLSPAAPRQTHGDPELMRVGTAKLRYWDGYFYEVRAFRQNVDEVLALLTANLATGG